MSKTDVLRFADAWRECQTHLRHARYAVASLAPHLPLTGMVLGELDLEIIQDIDQLVLRYSRLQDCMGNRLFPALLKILMEPFEDRPMLDKLHRLEKMGVLPSVARWQELREIRNSFAHDYPDDDAIKAAALSAACLGLEELGHILVLVGQVEGVAHALE